MIFVFGNGISWTEHAFHVLCHDFMLKFIPKSVENCRMSLTMFENDGVYHRGCVISRIDEDKHPLYSLVTIIEDTEENVIKIALPMIDEESTITISADLDDTSFEVITAPNYQSTTGEKREKYDFVLGIIGEWLKRFLNQL